MNIDEKLKLAEFFRLWDNLFYVSPSQKQNFDRKKDRKLNRNKQVFCIALEDSLAHELRKISQEVNRTPNYIISVVLKDYLTARKIK